MKKAFLCFFFLLAVAACGSGGGSGSTSAGNNQTVGLSAITPPETAIVSLDSSSSGSSLKPATVRVLLTDAPNSSIESAEVTLGGMTIHKTGGAFFSVFEGERTLDLMDLQNGITTLLGEISLEPGKYTQIRSSVVSGSVVSGGETYGVVIPSGQIKLNRTIDVCSGGNLEIVIDFDANQSLKYNKGQNVFKMSPVVKIAAVTSECPAEEGAGEEETSYTGPTGWLSIVIPPLPTDDITYTLNTTIEDIRVHDQGIGQVSTFTEAYEVDLLDPERQISGPDGPLYTVLVPPVQVPAGELDQIRLLFPQIVAADSQGRTITIKLPAEEDSESDGLKFFGSIEVCENALTILQWDLDLSPAALNFENGDSTITIHPEIHDINLRTVCEPYTE
jgi:hypothetical protein